MTTNERRLWALAALLSQVLCAACGSDSSTSTPGGPTPEGGTKEAGAGSGGASQGSGGKSGTGAAAGSVGSGGTASTSPEAGIEAGIEAGVDAGIHCALGSTWEVVDDYAHPGATNTNPGQLATTPDGHVYATGMALTMGKATGLFRSSANGTTFTLVKALAGIGGDLVAAPDGAFFVAGGADDGKSRTVQRSTDGGQTWEVVDSVPLVAGACNTGYLAVTSGGVVYCAGSCDTQGWHVRMSKDGGDTWSDVGTPFQFVTGMPARLSDIHVAADDSVYVSGIGQDANQIGHWLVRKLDSNGTFMTVDNFLTETTKSAISPTLAGTDRVYAVGGAEATGGNQYIVRRADAEGTTWETIDSFVPKGATGAVASGLYEAPDGTLVSVGTATGMAMVTSVITRISTDEGRTWTDGAPYSYAAGKSSQATGHLVQDSRGNVYGAVRGVASDDHAHAVIRRLVCK